MKRALVTGFTGQDGSYLAEYLLDEGYEVFVMVRRSSHSPFVRAPHLEGKVSVLHANLQDYSALAAALEKSKPDEIYNLAAQSHVGISFECPWETEEVNYHGVGRLVGLAMEQNPKVRIYQASTSEMFGTTKPPQNEDSPMDPVSPYAKAKLRAHEDYVVGYREKHGLYICSGILFNHESPRRGENFVTRKITLSFAKIKNGDQEFVELGNLNACRDWGFAGDYVKAMHKMLQLDAPEDFVIGTGETHTVRSFAEAAAKAHGMELTWEGEGVDEVGKDRDGVVRVKVNPKFYRPQEVDALRADCSKAKKVLGWQPETSFEELVAMMTKSDLAYIKTLS